MVKKALWNRQYKNGARFEQRKKQAKVSTSEEDELHVVTKQLPDHRDFIDINTAFKKEAASALYVCLSEVWQCSMLTYPHYQAVLQLQTCCTDAWGVHFAQSRNGVRVSSWWES